MSRPAIPESVCILGAGPIRIGQACEFDYSGVQGVKALREEGCRVVLVNSNPATVMTDVRLAHRSYVEPLTLQSVTAVLERERPDALIPTLGGQTALNLAVELEEAGVLERLGIKLLGASVRSIRLAEDREEFRQAMTEAGLPVLPAITVTSIEEGMAALDTIGLPAILRPSFTLGGWGGGAVHDRDSFVELLRHGLDASPTNQVLVETSVIGWKEFELEVMRDSAGAFVVVCSIENVDPMGVHTGDSITVAPAQTLTDREYQVLRDAARGVLDAVGVATGGANVQFAVNPEDGRYAIIEMNPRVSRSSALASKATGFPIARIAAKVALGRRLDEISNDITGHDPGQFRTRPRLRGRQDPSFCLREIPRLRARPRHRHEGGRRGRRHGAVLRGGPAQGDSLARDRSRFPRRAGRSPGGGRRWSCARDSPHPLPKDCGSSRRVCAAAGPRSASSRSPRSIPGSCAGSVDWWRPRPYCGTRNSMGRLALQPNDSALPTVNWRGSRERSRDRTTASARSRTAPDPAPGRHLRRRVRGPNALSLRQLRRPRRAARGPPIGGHPRWWSGADRPGHRVRRLLCRGGGRDPLRGLRSGDGQLQSRDRVHRLRRRRSAPLRSSPHRRRARHLRCRTSGGRHRPAWRPDPAQARRRPRKIPDPDLGHAPRRHRSGRGSGSFFGPAERTRSAPTAGQNDLIRRSGRGRR